MPVKMTSVRPKSDRSNSPKPGRPQTGHSIGISSAPTFDAGPTRRGDLHHKKTTAVEMRRIGTPGPGKYETKSSLNHERGMTAASFRTTVDRSKNPGPIKGQWTRTDPTLGPGAYNIDKMHNGLNWAMASGHGESGGYAFKQTGEIGLKLNMMGEQTPGPGMYYAQRRMNGENATMADGSGESSGYVFNSKVEKMGKVMWEFKTDTPGPGSYDAQKDNSGQNLLLADARGESASHSFRSTSKRASGYPDNSKRTDPKLGPGCYEVDKLRNGLNWTMAKEKRGEGKQGTSAFRSDVSRDGWMVQSF